MIIVLREDILSTITTMAPSAAAHCQYQCPYKCVSVKSTTRAVWAFLIQQLERGGLVIWRLWRGGVDFIWWWTFTPRRNLCLYIIVLTFHSWAFSLFFYEVYRRLFLAEIKFWLYICAQIKCIPDEATSYYIEYTHLFCFLSKFTPQNTWYIIHKNSTPLHFIPRYIIHH